MTQEIIVENEPRYPSGPQSRWQENHGNLLMTFVAIVLAVGACVLIYRQNRFVPPRFPDADMIETPQPVEEVSQIDAKNTLTVKVVGAANDLGTIKIAIYDSESTFDRTENAVARETVRIVEGEAVWIMPVPPSGKVAVAAYHDENGDDQLNRNRLGIPTERYGFSRNARGLTGPPSFNETVIELPNAGDTITIYIR